MSQGAGAQKRHIESRRLYNKIRYAQHKLMTCRWLGIHKGKTNILVCDDTLQEKSRTQITGNMVASLT